MKMILSLIITWGILNQVYAQNTKIEVELFVKGKPVDFKNGIKMSLINQNDTIKLSTSDNSFYLPDTLINKRKNFLIQAGGYSFYFDETILTIQPLLHKWEIYYDYKPFLEENKWLLNTCKQKVKCLYSLNYNTGNLITYFKPKRLPQSRKFVNKK
jgi:hypothetical protein